MKAASNDFAGAAEAALGNRNLQKALGIVREHSIAARAAAVQRLPEFEALRDRARDLKTHILAELDRHLLTFEKNVIATGGEVHWCRDAAAAREAVLAICRRAGARKVTKGKTMIGEEIAINDSLAAAGMEPIETDLGEYIIQLRGETPSHIIGPAIHVTQAEVETAFRRAHDDLDPWRSLDDAQDLLAEARQRLREKFLAADIGITGANFLIADEGATIIVTNEGNGDLTEMLPPIHIVLASIEKVVPSLTDAFTLLRLLPRSATGQEQSVYTTISTGPRRAGDREGPREFHVILLDNGRSAALGSEIEAMLRCIRCGACLDHCPVYHTTGGHAYGWVYSGPIGAVLTPALLGPAAAKPLPFASTLCGRCESVCPVRIPLPSLLRHWREREFADRLSPTGERSGMALWSRLLTHPRLYGFLQSLANRWLRWQAGKSGRIRRLFLAGGWMRHRDLPAPSGKTFRELWREGRR